MKKIIFIITILSVGLVFILYRALANDTEIQEVSKTDKKVEFIHKFHFNTGNKLIYKFHSNSDMKIDLNPDPTQHTIIDQTIVLDATLNLNVIQDLNGSFLVAAQFSNLSMNLPSKELTELYKKMYSKIFFLELSPYGDIENFRFMYAKKDYKGIMQTFYTLQVLLEDDTLYTTREDEVNGIVEANYERNGRDTIKKNRIKYLSLDKDNKITIPQSTIDIKIDNRWIKTLESKEKFIVFQDNKQVVKSLNKLTIEKNLNLFDKTTEIWSLSQKDLLDLYAKYLKNTNVSLLKKLEQQVLAKSFKSNKVTFDSLYEELKNSQKLSDFIKLRKYITLYPKEAIKLFTIIQNIDELFASKLINVLETSGTSEAQNVLKKIVQSEDVAHMTHVRGVVALGGIEKPTEETIDFLWEMYDNTDNENSKDLSNTSLLSLGILSNKTSQSDAIKSRLKSEYTDHDNKSIVLLSMQNAGAKTFKSEIVDALKSNNNYIKATAIEALKGIEAEDIQDKITNIMHKENNRKINRKIASYVKSITPNEDLMVSVRKNVFIEKDNYARKDYITTLLINQYKYPQNVEILKKLGQTEKDKDNLVLLKKYGY